MVSKLTLFLWFSLFISPSFEANILFFFTGGTYSHDIAIWPLAVKLADRNHSVTFFSAHSKKPWKDDRIEIINPPKIEEINSKYLGDTLKARLNHEEKLLWRNLHMWSYDICEYILTNPEKPETKPIFYDKNFDIVIIDAAVCDCGYIAGYFHQAKVIVADSTSVLTWFHDIFGFPTEFTWVPATSTFFQHPMTFFNILENYFELFYMTYIRRNYFYPKLDNLARQLVKNDSVATFLEMERRADIIFLNTHPSVELPRSLPPNAIQIGGLQMFGQKNATIPKNVQDYIDEAEEGVILLAFGSSIDFTSLPRNIETAFFDAFRRFPKITFIAKANGKRQENCPENLKYEKWIPQKEILAHPKTLACITHGGLNGIIEATWNAVPLITLPIFAEQDHQSYKLQAREVGIRLELRDLTANSMADAIANIISDPRYRKNMIKLQAAFKDRPQTPVEVATYWTEFVLRHDDISFMKPIIYQTWNTLAQDLLFSQSFWIIAGITNFLIVISSALYFRVK